MDGQELTLGSLFDGSGTFPLGALMTGIRPVWSSEIEPFPIRVTTKRMPGVRHYGDVRGMHGGRVEPVDIITFGSPCTDMSLAGKRAGLDGRQSCLFYEAIRIVKEMRRETDGRYPRFIVFENVTGAFSSRKGRDFQTVLTEIVRIKEPESPPVPMPDAAWPTTDLLLGDGWSAAYRVFDSQGWGVPQRRRRIYLVGDLGGGCAGKILFDTESVLGDSAACFRSWKGTADRLASGPAAAGGALSTGLSDAVAPPKESTVVSTVDVRLTSEGTKNARNNVYETDVSRCLDTSGTTPDRNYGGVAVVERGPAYVMTTGSYAQVEKDIAPTLMARDYKDPDAVCWQSGTASSVTRQDGSVYAVRRLTPAECARLQGFPDWWCRNLGTENPSEEEMQFWREVFETHRRLVSKAKKPKTDRQIRKWLKNPHTDSAEYRMWGNGCTLPVVYYVLAGIAHFASQD